MTLGSLFSGIGGFELAGLWAGITPVWSNEIDPYCCKVLRKNFKHEIIEKDIREIGRNNLGSVDIISGGFPCQPFSTAGKRKGTNDNRYLWPEMLRVIGEVKPSWIIGENVAGLQSMENGKTLEKILIDLESIGYNPEIFSIPACGVGAWHRRDRIWIVCHPKHVRFNATEIEKGIRKGNDSTQTGTNQAREPTRPGRQNVSNAVQPGPQKERLQQRESDSVFKKASNEPGPNGVNGNWWTLEPELDRVANGVPNRVDRIKGLGNAIVPQVAYQLFMAIKQSSLF